MESKNPVFANSGEWKAGGHASFDAPSSDRRTPPADADARTLEDWYRRPPATPSQSRRMTLDDVVVRTAAFFAVLLVGAGVAWYSDLGFGVAIGTALIAMVMGIWAQVSKKVRPGVMFAYAGLEGLFVGAISNYYTQAFGSGLVTTAVVGTLCAFAAMLVAYKLKIVRATPKFAKVLLIAVLGYAVFGLVNLVLSLTGIGNVYAGGGILAVGVSAIGVVLASLFLVLDFDHIERGIRNQLPVKESWRAAFGLTVTLVWLYLEILRLVALLRGNN